MNISNAPQVKKTWYKIVRRLSPVPGPSGTWTTSVRAYSALEAVIAADGKLVYTDYVHRIWRKARIGGLVDVYPNDFLNKEYPEG